MVQSASRPGAAHRTEAVFERYHVGWETRDPDYIAASHSEDTVFQMHDGSPPVIGRDALRESSKAMFATYDFTFEPGRLLFGDDHWVFEWKMVLSLADKDGTPFEAGVEMLDVVTLNEADEVTRKDVYMNGAQAQQAFMRAGIER